MLPLRCTGMVSPGGSPLASPRLLAKLLERRMLDASRAIDLRRCWAPAWPAASDREGLRGAWSAPPPAGSAPEGSRTPPLYSNPSRSTPSKRWISEADCS